jgi:O-succinylbenzoate synthase
LGGIRNALKLICDARNNGLRSVISSSFESGIGIHALAHIAAGGGKDVTAGIDTLKYLKKDLLKKPLEFKDGKIDVSRNILESDICFDDLREI